MGRGKNMEMKTNLSGRIKNMKLAESKCLMPLFEAVVNSIHAIEDNPEQIGKGFIKIEVLRSNQKDIFDDTEISKEIQGFTITDNGIGFNKANMESFNTLDSDYKVTVTRGGKGIGRLYWLLSFKSVHIYSRYIDNNHLQQISFLFDLKSQITENNEDFDLHIEKTGTKVCLNYYEEKYKKIASKKNLKTIATELLEHCLWFYLRPKGAPRIIVSDSIDEIDLDTLYSNYMKKSPESEEVQIKTKNFTVMHVHQYEIQDKPPVLVLTANEREVSSTKLGDKITGIKSKLQDETGVFSYSCYISSPYLDENVRADRQEFDIAPKQSDSDLLIDEPSIEEIESNLVSKIGSHLSDCLIEGIKKTKVAVENFVSNKAPKYRPVLGRISQDELCKGLDETSTDREIEEILHRELFKIEQKLLQDGNNILNPVADEDYAAYMKRIEEYMSIVSDVSKSGLVEYVWHRRAVIALLESFLTQNEDGSYPLEEKAHKLIMPMRSNSNDVFFEQQNLWLIDERLAFHDYLASDLKIGHMDITAENSDGTEPDIVSLNVYDNPILITDREDNLLSSITIIEFKRPMRGNFNFNKDKNNPISQVIDYLERIRDGKICTARGRPLNPKQEIRGYCYVICDPSESLRKICDRMDFEITSDGEGYYLPHKKLKADIEVIFYDKLIREAKQRNYAFFQKLGLPAL
jgi:hypothetical protein